MAALNLHDDTFDRVVRYQFYQDTPGEATVRVVPAAGFGEDDRRRILRTLGVRVDGQVRLTIETIDAIPLTHRGKAVLVDQRIERDKLPT
jgi:phenylacetate-CoA ligase